MARLSRHNINLRVKRRLFGDDNRENKSDNEFKFNQENSFGISSSKSIKNEEKLESILVISSIPSSNVMDIFREHATAVCPTVDICYCVPENAYMQCKKLLYTVIFTDIDLSENSEMLRLIVSIRKTSNFNQLTPIVAVGQTQQHHHGNSDLAFYGVDEVYRGNVEGDIIENILSKYIKTESGTNEQQSIGVKKEMITSSSSDKKSDVLPSSTRTTTTTSQSSSYDGRNIKTVNFSSKCTPKVEINKVFKPTTHRPVLPKPVHNIAPSFFTPPLSVAAMRRPSVFPLTQVLDTTPQSCYPYLANATELKPTVVHPDLKHSTKERLRRERIKMCCDQMRILLPKSHRKKADMASVFEFAVLYIRIMQAHSPPSLTEKCESIFKIVSKKDAPKRKYSTVFSEANLPSKEMRRNGTSLDHTCFTRSHNQVSDAALKSSQPCSSQNQIQSSCKYSNPHEQANNGVPFTLTRSVPSHYQTNDYVNYGFENYAMYPSMNQQMSENTYMKESALLNDVPLNIPIEYNQFHGYYPHYS